MEDSAVKVPIIKPMPYVKTEKKQRLSEFDLLKFIAMSYVVISHVLQRIINAFTTTWKFAIFYSVHMSMFMFASGYFIRRPEKFKNLVLYILKLVAVFLFPAILFTIITIYTIQYYNTHDILFWLNEFIIHTDTFYWYFIAAFFINSAIEIGYFIANKIVKSGSLKRDVLNSFLNIIFSAILLSPFIWLYANGNGGFLSSNQIVYLAPICMVGFLIKTFLPYLKKIKPSKLLAFRIVMFLTSFIAYAISMYYFQNWLDMPTTEIMIYHMLGSLAGVLSYYYLCLFLTHFKPFKKLAEFGKYSMQMYLVGVLLLRAITPYVSKVIVFDLYGYAFIVGYALFVWLGSLMLSIFLTNWKVTDVLLFGNYKRFLKNY